MAARGNNGFNGESEDADSMSRGENKGKEGVMEGKWQSEARREESR